MIRKIPVILFLTLQMITVGAQNYSGTVSDVPGDPLENVKVFFVEDELEIITDAEGNWSQDFATATSRTIIFHKDGYTYEQLLDQDPASGITISLRDAHKSHASIREESYIKDGCASVVIPTDAEWDISFEVRELEGDLAPDNTYTRRDPSAVIQVDGTYYMWYSYSLTFDGDKIAPWDLNDIYYSTSTDGIYWEEQGLAVGRGVDGSFDHRSVFTTEIFVHEGRYYLVYQAAADQDGIYNRNRVGMASASSPNGPWTKISDPVLHPTYTNDIFFDNNAVHDPCIVHYKEKFYLYYKGECNCMDANDCEDWCNPVCGLHKQVKWGVAIADSPTGPYVKSDHNPVTNTGHEVMIWPYQDGMAILQHKDGPEANSIQFAGDGLNFDIMGTVSYIPEAAGLFRANKSDTDPHAGINWGMGHKLMWNAGPNGWMYIYRFDKLSK